MTADGLRNVRLFFKLGLLVTLPLAGYLWAALGTSTVTIVVTALCAVMALGSEGMASTEESRLVKARKVAEAEEQAYNAEIAIRAERIRQMDRIVETLSNQSHDLRGQLVAMNSELQRVEEQEREKAVAATEPAEAVAETAEPAEEQAETGGGEVTDLNSIRNRR